MWKSLCFALIFIISAAAGATDLKPMKKWVVFPFDTKDEQLKPSVDQAWWNVREKITEKKRFYVASKQFLLEKEVFQPRGELKKDDVDYLTRHLDADVIVTGFNEYRDFTLNIYLAQTGRLIWSKRLGFHPSLRASDQLLSVSQRLITEAMDRIPYQGVLINSEEKTKDKVTIDVGNNDTLNAGDEVSFLKITLPEKADSDFTLDQLQTSILGLGRVSKTKKGSVIVDVKDLPPTEGQAVFVSILKEKKDTPYQNQLTAEMAPTVEEDVGRVNSHSRQTVIFGSVFSFLGILLLAF